MTNNGKGKEQRHMITKHRPQRNGDGGNRDERQHRFCFGENNKIQLRKIKRTSIRYKRNRADKPTKKRKIAETRNGVLSCCWGGRWKMEKARGKHKLIIK
jgi:hypothetical protein